MKKIIFYSLISLLLLTTLVLYVKNDIETIYNKALIKDEKTSKICKDKHCLSYENIERLNNVLKDKDIKWEFSLVSYSISNYYKLSTDNLFFNFLDGYIVLNYKSIYGWVQVVSCEKIRKLEKKINE